MRRLESSGCRPTLPSKNVTIENNEMCLGIRICPKMRALLFGRVLTLEIKTVADIVQAYTLPPLIGSV